MQDLEDRLRELGESGEQNGHEAPLELRPTPGALRRIRVGRAVRSGAVLATVAVLVIGGFLGARSLSNDAAPIRPADEIEKKDSTLVDFPNLTTTFFSPRNGFSIKVPDRVEIMPAKQLFGFGEHPDDGFDVVETGLTAVFEGASTTAPDMENGVVAGSDMSIDEWVDDVSPGDCGIPRSRRAEITIDGQPGRLSECRNKIEATVVFGGRLYLFNLLHDRSDARALFDAFAATIDLTPETAVDFPNLTTTFVSPTYGFSFNYLDRGKGTLTPAKELWDPVDQPPIDDLGSSDARYLDEFDLVETGLAAVFLSASTEVPDGVSIDDWVEASVAKYRPAGCYMPPRGPAEITIDGESARLLECTNRVEATVISGGRLYLFVLGHSRTDGRAFFDAWVDTIDLTPETAAVP